MSTIIKSGTGTAVYSGGQYHYEEDTSFVTGESPYAIDFDSEIGKPASNGYVINDGAGNFTIAFKKKNGGDYGDEITMKSGEIFDLKGKDVAQLRITWVADSSFRVYGE
jgi:hypothetical protein